MQSINLIPRHLRNCKIILASNSPRRKELLALLGLDFEVVNNLNIDETLSYDIPPTQQPEVLAIRKAQSYLPQLNDNEILITADTIVVADNQALGKPHNRQEAIQMLESLSGRTHSVVTGVVVCNPSLQVSFSVTTEVDFADLSREDIELYVDTFSPMDKAGAYGIQEWIGAIGITGIRGSFYNVMGLPVHYLYEVLKHFPDNMDGLNSSMS